MLENNTVTLSPDKIAMGTNKESNLEKPPLCPFCNGSGQTSFFGGESRFMFTWEDCPDCCGTGIKLDDSRSFQKETDPSAPEQ